MAQSAAEWDAHYGRIEGMHVWRDMLCLPCMPQDLMDEMIDKFVFRPDDVLLVSYPQSSFNWIQEVLWHLHNLDTLNIPVSEKEVLACRVPFLEHLFKTQDPRSLVNFPSPRLLKTHLSYRYWADNLQPVKDKLKVILWVAEPKDTIANYYRFWSTKGKFFDFPEIEWNYFFDLFKRDKLFEGNWYETNISWLKAYENDPRMLVLSYEQTRSDPRGCVSKMADFLEIVVTDEELKKLVSVVEFDKWPDWSTVYNIEQKQYIDHLTRTKLVGTPLEHLYPCDIGII